MIWAMRWRREIAAARESADRAEESRDRAVERRDEAEQVNNRAQRLEKEMRPALVRNGFAEALRIAFGSGT